MLEVALVAGAEARPNDRRDPLQRSRSIAVAMNYFDHAFKLRQLTSTFFLRAIDANHFTAMLIPAIPMPFWGMNRGRNQFRAQPNFRRTVE